MSIIQCHTAAAVLPYAVLQNKSHLSPSELAAAHLAGTLHALVVAAGVLGGAVGAVQLQAGRGGVLAAAGEGVGEHAGQEDTGEEQEVGGGHGHRGDVSGGGGDGEDKVICLMLDLGWD